MKIVLTMAGEGSRTKDFSPDYKPFIKVHGRTLLELSMLGLPNATEIYLVVHESWADKTKELLKTVDWLDTNLVHIVPIEKLTAGQAETALLGMSTFSENTPILISNCDTFFTDNFPKETTLDGLLGTFTANSPNYSYVKTSNGVVTMTAEKEVISNMASAGLYYFSSKKLYKEVYESSVFSGERYIAPLYNSIIHQNYLVGQFKIDYVYPLGTSNELKTASADHSLVSKIQESLWQKENQKL